MTEDKKHNAESNLRVPHYFELLALCAAMFGTISALVSVAATHVLRIAVGVLCLALGAFGMTSVRTAVVVVAQPTYIVLGIRSGTIRLDASDIVWVMKNVMYGFTSNYWVTVKARPSGNRIPKFFMLRGNGARNLLDIFRGMGVSVRNVPPT